ATAGPWTYVSPDDLPASFRRIPADSEKAAVLTFVPGSAPARDALRDANTPESVLRIRGRYYVCDQGVWFSGDAPVGPWRVADSIPDDDIQRIPPESPVYNTRFATVYDSTPDVVYVAYTPAYLGSYPYYGTVVFGKGWF